MAIWGNVHKDLKVYMKGMCREIGNGITSLTGRLIRIV